MAVAAPSFVFGTLIWEEADLAAKGLRAAVKP